MPEEAALAIGRLRWTVMLATRAQAADPNGTGILETLQHLQRVKADVQPTGALTFRLGVQEDSGFTHRVFVRWVSGLRVNEVIFRTTREADGTQRTERFRVWRWKELAGRNRFALAEVTLEGYVNPDGTYDAAA